LAKDDQGDTELKILKDLKFDMDIRGLTGTDAADRAMRAATRDIEKIQADINDTIMKYDPARNAIAVLMAKADEKRKKAIADLKADTSISGRIVKHAKPDLVIDPDDPHPGVVRTNERFYVGQGTIACGDCGKPTTVAPCDACVAKNYR
jgi:hypothetical protein